MPPMERENHENLLNELNDSELTHERRTEILSELRQDYGTVHTDFENINQANEKFKNENESLVKANSKLFWQLGMEDNPEMKKEEQAKSFSETVRIPEV